MSRTVIVVAHQTGQTHEAEALSIVIERMGA